MSHSKLLSLVAQRQHGYFTANQARDAGYDTSLQSYHVRKGNWQRIDWALYRLPGFDDSTESEFVRWTLWFTRKNASRRAVVCDKSALHYYGLTGEQPDKIDFYISTPLKHSDAGADEIVYHLYNCPTEDCLHRPGFLITSPLRTLRDVRPDFARSGNWTGLVLQALTKGLIGAQQADELTGRATSLAMGGLAMAKNATTVFRMGLPATVNAQGREGRVANRSFTLVEMLVVIAIMSVLMAMLMPAMSRAVITSRTVSCTSNTHQIGLCIAGYVSDSDNILPHDTRNRGYWRQLLLPYASAGAIVVYPDPQIGKGVFRCPAWQDMPAIGPAGNYQQSGYGWNIHYMGFTDDAGNNTGYTYLGRPIPSYVRQNKLRRPAESVLSADCSNTYYSEHPDSFYYLAAYPPKFTYLGIPLASDGAQHAGGVNIGWADLHASFMPMDILKLGRNGDADYYFSSYK